MIGNFISGALSVAQGDSPEEILKKQMMTTAMGGTAPTGVESASNSMMSTLAEQGVADAGVSHLGSQLGGELTNNMVTQNPALTNGLGQSSNMLTQFGRDASKMATNAYDNVSDTVGQGFDWLNDKTGLEKKDYTMLAMNQGANLLQPTPQEPITPAPAGQGISQANMDLTKPQGLLSSLTPATTTAYPSPEPISDLTQINQFSNVVDGLRNADASPSQQQQYMLSKNPEALETILTPEQIMKLKQQGIL